jgi:hypothetical protein
MTKSQRKKQKKKNKNKNKSLQNIVEDTPKPEIKQVIFFIN